MTATFETDLAKAIRSKIAEMKKEGITGASVECLKQNVKAPAGGPSGTNAAWVYNEIFNEVAKGLMVRGFEIYSSLQRG